jgi:tRNA(Ile)-lysidine synthase
MDLLDIDQVAALLSDSKTCLIGVSGGLDSMSLLHWIAAHKNQLPCNIKAMHVDHGINSSSSQWADFVVNECKKLEIECQVVKVSLDGLGNNLEYAARKARYKAFCESGADSIMLAHHANDQCESFLLKLFRGSGVRGLKSMVSKSACWYDAAITVIRPMLDVTRTQIELWCEEHTIAGVDDPSNLDNKYDRNYIRNCIWPAIMDRFGIADVNTIRSISHLDEAWQLTSALADIDLAAVLLPDGSLDWYKTQELGYLRIKNMLLRLLGREGVYSFSIGQVENFAQGIISANLDNRNQLMVKGLTLNKVGKRIHIDRQDRKAA